MTLTKADIIQKIADGCGFSKGESTEIVENSHVLGAQPTMRIRFRSESWHTT